MVPVLASGELDQVGFGECFRINHGRSPLLAGRAIAASWGKGDRSPDSSFCESPLSGYFRRLLLGTLLSTSPNCRPKAEICLKTTKTFTCGHCFRLTGLMKRVERVAELIEKAGREEADFIAVRFRRFLQITPPLTLGPARPAD
jgi:hypothetical protein